MQTSKKEQRGGIRFLAAGRVGGREMHRRMKAVYGEYSLCSSGVVEWRKRFLEGRKLLEDDACVCVTWTGSLCHHTGYDCGSECFRLGQPQNHRRRVLSVNGY
ncbi:uncharacterized protein TNCT_433431 [Trichonephila clavata]|uniref:Transposase n=1 Tax=Trichonephila clavata TaxID=2740835 RepID=A0A8X6L8R6_TRICU|nr:uncharacterized protein TNCT_433431 [Trichonephila clavata]